MQFEGDLNTYIMILGLEFSEEEVMEISIHLGVDSADNNVKYVLTEQSIDLKPE